METVRAFYVALGSAHGDEAVSLVIPEKRGSGPYNAAEISKYYASMSKPLQLVELSSLGENKYRADYSYGVRDNTCVGSAVVTVVQRNGSQLIQSIKPKDPKDHCSTQ
jgi:hypothetical protein